MKEIKRDWMNNDIVIIAEDRLNRPMYRVPCDEETELIKVHDTNCPFCRGNEDFTPNEKFRIDGKYGWSVRSTDNKYPIIDNASDGVYGFHEVMIDTYRHDGSFYNMSVEEFVDMFKMYRDRYISFLNKINVEYVSIFKNFLRKAGASLQHPHSQIISISMIPPDIGNELIVAKNYYDEKKKCLYIDMIEKEIEYKERVVYNNKQFLIIIPDATRYAGEVRVIFKEKIKFEEIDDIVIKELSIAFNKLFENLYRVNGYCPFNLYIHTHPINVESKPYFNVHIHIIPRRYSYGGFELGNGIYVSSLKPEKFAKKIRF